MAPDHFSLTERPKMATTYLSDLPVFGNPSAREIEAPHAHGLSQAHPDVCSPFGRKEVPPLPLPDLGGRLHRRPGNPQDLEHTRLGRGPRSHPRMGSGRLT